VPASRLSESVALSWSRLAARGSGGGGGGIRTAKGPRYGCLVANVPRWASSWAAISRIRPVRRHARGYGLLHFAHLVFALGQLPDVLGARAERDDDGSDDNAGLFVYTRHTGLEPGAIADQRTSDRDVAFRRSVITSRVVKLEKERKLKSKVVVCSRAETKAILKSGHETSLLRKGKKKKHGEAENTPRTRRGP
jgi:hypothetical protein